MKGLIISQYQNNKHQFTEEGWFNATEAAKPFNQCPDDWICLDKTQEYMSIVADTFKISEPKLLIRNKRGSNTVTSQNGHAQGTWLHPKLAVPFACWLDTRFGVWCDMQIDQLIRGNHQAMDVRKLRHQAASTYKAVCSVLQISKQQQGKETKPYHYMNEARLINWAMTGQFTGLNRDSLSYNEMDLLAELENQDLVLIGSNCTYEQRKNALYLFAQNFKTKQLSHYVNVLEA